MAVSLLSHPQVQHRMTKKTKATSRVGGFPKQLPGLLPRQLLAKLSVPRRRLLPKGACKQASATRVGAGENEGPDNLKMPPLTATSPIVYRGCKVYTSEKARAWRVVPYPGVSVYDRKIKWGSSPAKAWEALKQYCQAPFLPDSRKSDIR